MTRIWHGNVLVLCILFGLGLVSNAAHALEERVDESCNAGVKTARALLQTNSVKVSSAVRAEHNVQASQGAHAWRWGWETSGVGVSRDGYVGVGSAHASNLRTNSKSKISFISGVYTAADDDSTNPLPFVIMGIFGGIIAFSTAFFALGIDGAEGKEDVEKRTNQNLDEDTYGFAISSLVRDIMMIVDGQGTFALRFFRLALSISLHFFSIFLQIFLILQIKLICTAKAVHDIREVYDEYEFVMYGSMESHTTLTVNGKHRGIDEFFQPELFSTLTEKMKEAICNIPLSQPSFFFVVLFIWTLTCIGEVKKVNSLFLSLIIATPTSDTMQGALVEENQADEDGDGVVNEKVIAHLTLPLKAFVVFGVLLPRLFITSYLLFLGCRWLTATNDFSDLVMNAVALEFILLLKDLLYQTLVPDRNKRDLMHTEIRPPTKTQPASYWSFLATFSWAIVAAGWCWCYMFHLQRVLPEYGWDVREVCLGWLAKETKTL